MKLLSVTLILYLALQTTESSTCLATTGLGTWISVANGTIPPNGVIAGYNTVDDPLYICRFNGINGKLSTKTYRKCLTLIHGQPASSSVYEILTSVTSVWIPVINNDFPCNQLQTGTINGTPTYSSRAHFNGELSVGQVSRGVSYIGDNTTIIYSKQYEILTATPVTNINGAYYGLNGNILSFRARGPRETVVWLGISNSFNFRITIGLLMNSLSAIGTRDDPSGSIVSTKNIIHATEYRGFWIRINDCNDIEFGKEGDLGPLLTYNHPDVHKINSVKFGDIGSYDGSTYLIPALARW